LGKNRVIRMPYSVPVSIEYLTAFVSEGVLNIRPDIYDYDQPLFNQLLTKTKK
jgi:murein L,D-transpeptidase YcbB/YkuD